MSNSRRSLAVSLVLAFGFGICLQFGCGVVRQYVPIIVDLKVEKKVLEPGEQTEIRAKIAAEDRKKLTSTWTTPNGFTINNWSASDEVGTVVAPSTSGAEAELTLKITNKRGNTDERSITVRTVENKQPKIVDVSAAPRTVEPGGAIELSATATDENDGNLTYAWSAPANWSFSNASDAQTTLTAPNAFGASATVQLTVTDPEGASATRTLHLSTTENEAPVITSVQAQPSTVGPSETTTLNVQADDSEGSSLSYTWSGPSNWSIASSNSQQTQVTAPSSYGNTATFTIQVTDAEGATTSGEILVSVQDEGGPQIVQLTASPQQAQRGGQLLATVSTDGGSNLSYSWSASNNWSVTPSSSDPSEATVTAPNTPTALGTVQVTVTGTSGQTATASTAVSTVQNEPPIITKPEEDLALSDAGNPSPLYPGRPVTVDPLRAEDPDGDTLTYSLQSNTGATIDSSTGVISWTPTFSDSGFYTWTVKVSDGYDTVKRQIEIGVSPTFGLSVASTTSLSGEAGTFADVDGDGYQDFIRVTQNCRLRISNGGAQGFASSSTTTSGRTGCSADFDTPVPAVADLGSDGDLDVVIVSEEGTGGASDALYWYVWKNDGSGNFSAGASGSWPVGDSLYANVGDIEAGDVDGDGNPDLVTVLEDSWVVGFNDGSASFGTYTETTGVYDESDNVAIADFVAGGNPEIVVTNSRGFDQTGVVEFWRVSGGTSVTKLSQVLTASSGTSSTPGNLGIADFDGDSDPDVAVYDDDTQQITYLENKGSGSFVRAGSVSSGGELANEPEAMHLATGNMDGDGNIDIVAGVDGFTEDLVVVRGDGSLGAKSVVSLDNIGTVNSQLIADWNGDGTPDLLFGGGNSVGIAK
jgi:predicted secreted protein